MANEVAGKTEDRMTAAELRSLFRDLREDMDGVLSELADLKQALSLAGRERAEGTVTTPTGQTYRDFLAIQIVLSYDDKGQPTYKAKGVPFMKYGVRIWPEVLPALAIDPDQLRPGPNTMHRMVRAEMGEQGPRRVIGLAP